MDMVGEETTDCCERELLALTDVDNDGGIVTLPGGGSK